MKLANNILRDSIHRAGGAAYGAGGVQTPPPIPYERFERSKTSKHNGNASVFKLRTNPSNDDSPTYELKVFTFKSGTVEEYIDWKKDFIKVCIGQNVTDGPGKYAMARRLLEGDALAAFNRAATATGNETNANLTTVLEELARHVFPLNALANQKQWFRRYLRKPNKHTIREYVARVNEMNAMLSEFPPLFNATQLIPEDEIKDLIEFSVPWQWKLAMTKHGYRPVENDVQKTIDFCERQENAEKLLSAVRGENPDNSTNQQSWKRKIKKSGTTSWKRGNQFPKNENKKKRGRCVSFRESDGKDGCRLHPDAVTHTTAECRVVQAQIDNMKGTYLAQAQKRQKTSNNSTNMKYNNNKKPGGDFHTLLEEIEHVKARLEKEIKQRGQESGKRKRDDESELGEIVKKNEAENLNGHAICESLEENFHSELAELSLSDVRDSDLEGLDPLSDEELDA
jgi:hypothetical protein